jgi:hypothetical protein
MLTRRRAGVRHLNVGNVHHLNVGIIWEAPQKWGTAPTGAKEPAAQSAAGFIMLI